MTNWMQSQLCKDNLVPCLFQCSSYQEGFKNAFSKMEITVFHSHVEVLFRYLETKDQGKCTGLKISIWWKCIWESCVIPSGIIPVARGTVTAGQVGLPGNPVKNQFLIPPEDSQSSPGKVKVYSLSSLLRSLRFLNGWCSVKVSQRDLGWTVY